MRYYLRECCKPTTVTLLFRVDGQVRFFCGRMACACLLSTSTCTPRLWTRLRFSMPGTAWPRCMRWGAACLMRATASRLFTNRNAVLYIHIKHCATGTCTSVKVVKTAFTALETSKKGPYIAADAAGVTVCDVPSEILSRKVPEVEFFAGCCCW